MGVKGLTTFANINHHVFLKYYLLHDTELVIDGYSLCYQLYGRCNSNAAFGGDYDSYASYLRSFFKKLLKCNIKCYVLLDGSYEGRKIRTAFSRLRSKIKGAARLDPVTQTSIRIFPINLSKVFKAVLSELNVPYSTCEFEADDEIAAMARRLNCPVLSFDSDFFIYNVLYIPLPTLDSKPIVIEENNEKIYAIKCKLFKTKNLVDGFGIDESLLPLFGTVLGNDYVQKKVFRNFFSQLKLPKGKRIRNDTQRTILGLLNWLKMETLDSAISKIVGRMRKEHKRRIYNILLKGIEGYNSKNCNSLKYFDLPVDIIEEPSLKVTCNIDFDSETLEDEVLEAVEDEVGDDNDDSAENPYDSDETEESISDAEDNINGMPYWFSDLIRKKLIPHSYINLYTIHMCFGFPQAEDYHDEDAFLCALEVLRFAFDIMTDFSNDSLIYVSREKDCDYKKVVVGNDLSIQRITDKSFCDLSDDELKLYFQHFFQQKMPDLDLETLIILPSNFRIIMLSIIWWVSHCNVPKSYAHALFISYIMLSVIDSKTGMFRSHFFFNNKYSKKLGELRKRPQVECNSDIFLNKNKVTYEDSLLAASVLLEHFELSKEIKKRPQSYDIQKVHKFAQFQCCFKQFYSLNILCRCYFDDCSLEKFYNGTFVYNMATKLETQADPISFMDKYLKGANTVLFFYKSICKVFDDIVDRLGLKMTTTILEGKRRKRRKKKKDVSFLIENFGSDVLI